MKKMAKSFVVQVGKTAHVRAERDALAAGAAATASVTNNGGDDDENNARNSTTFVTTGAARAAATSATPWVVRLFYSFQDATQLFLVMEFVPGGDLMSMLEVCEVFDEKLARFYIAEILLALETVHAMDYIHRDVKPDNLLIDSNGHLKISGQFVFIVVHYGRLLLNCAPDFGLCSGLQSSRRQALYERLQHESSVLLRRFVFPHR